MDSLVRATNPVPLLRDWINSGQRGPASQSAVLPKKNAVRRFFLAQEVIKSELSVAILLATYICPVDLYLILF